MIGAREEGGDLVSRNALPPPIQCSGSPRYLKMKVAQNRSPRKPLNKALIQEIGRKLYTRGSRHWLRTVGSACYLRRGEDELAAAGDSVAPHGGLHWNSVMQPRGDSNTDVPISAVVTVSVVGVHFSGILSYGILQQIVSPRWQAHLYQIAVIHLQPQKTPRPHMAELQRV